MTSAMKAGNYFQLSPAAISKVPAAIVRGAFSLPAIYSEELNKGMTLNYQQIYCCEVSLVH
jgi:hypothetical protein